MVSIGYKVFLVAMLAVGADGHVDGKHTAVAARAIWVEAHGVGEDPLLVAAVAYEESRWKWAVSGAGACGILQVVPRFSRYTCRQMRSPRIAVRAGIAAIRYWRDRRKMGRRYRNFGWLCHYNSGNRCYASSRRYAGRVLRVYRKLKSVATRVSRPNAVVRGRHIPALARRGGRSKPHPHKR